MKKLLCILLAVLLCLPLLAACGKKDETPAVADDAQNTEDDAAARQAAEKAAAQQADKAAIAEAFNAKMTLPDLSALTGEGEGDGQGDEQGETTGFMPMAMVESLLATAEAMMNTPDATGNKPAGEVKFDTVFIVPISVLLALKDGVLYANIMGEPAWITLKSGVATAVAGLPLETENKDLMDAIMNEIMSNMGDSLPIDVNGVMEEAENVEVTPEQIQAVLDMLPKLTADDLIAAGNDLYVLSGDYIARFSMAVTNVAASFSMPEGEMPAAADENAAAAAAAQQAAGEAQMKEMIVGLVDALGLKIGFKLTGNVITGYSIDYEVDEAGAAAVNALLGNLPGGGHALGEQTQPATIPTGADDEDGEGEEEVEEDESKLKAGTSMHLLLTVNADELPTALEVAVTIPDEVALSANLTATYADKVVTGFTCTADATAYQDVASANEVVITPDPENEYYHEYIRAELLADMNVHAAVTFKPALFAPQAVGKPLEVAVTVTYDADSITRLLDGKPVATFEGLEFENDDNDMSDPQNMSFTLTATNQGQGLVRFVASSVAGSQSAPIGTLDVIVGSAPDFVAQADSPFVELSAMVEKLFEIEDLSSGYYAYVIGDNTYYFDLSSEYEPKTDPEHPDDEPEYVFDHYEAEFDCCVANTAEAPHDYYVIVTTNSEGALVLTPVRPATQP